METSLHRDLKEYYAGREARFEEPVDGYRIDVVTRGGRLIEIQHSALASIRDKIGKLLKDHKVHVVKPIVARKRLIKLSEKDGEVVSKRYSPKRCDVLDVFHELLHFTRVFPHKNLTLDVPIVEVEEWRYPGHGRRRRWRKNDFVVADQHLTSVHEIYRLRKASDLTALLGARLDSDFPKNFDTGQLAESLDISRWTAQRIAYCLREMGAAKEVEKRGNAKVYRFTRMRRTPTIVSNLRGL
jgi:hypothetical protein